MTGPARPRGTPTPGFLALGDSYTIGEGVEPAGRWPMQLAAALRAEGFALDDPRIIATTGWTTDELEAGIEAAEGQATIGSAQALVSLLVGVNNQYRGRPLAQFRSQFAALLARATGYAGGQPDRVLVLAIPDWGVTPFAAAQAHDPARIAAQIDAFNAACREETARAGAHWVDITAISRQQGGDAAMLVADGLHPSARMYAAWTALALPAARDALRG